MYSSVLSLNLESVCQVKFLDKGQSVVKFSFGLGRLSFH